MRYAKSSPQITFELIYQQNKNMNCGSIHNLDFVAEITHKMCYFYMKTN